MEFVALTFAWWICLCGLATYPSCGFAQSDLRSPHVGRVTRLYVDSTRRAWDGSGARPLQTTLWYPADSAAQEADWLLGPPNAPLFRLGRSAVGAPWRSASTQYPLIVLSHGTGGSAAMLGWLAEDLARAGYVVAAVDHHGNTANERSPAAAGFMLWWERAEDLSKIITELVNDPQIGPRIDARRIGEPETVTLMTGSGPVLCGGACRYAFGWEVRPTQGDATWSHGGALSGTTSHLVRTYHNFSWVVLFNARSWTSGFDAEINTVLWNALGQVTSFPTHDLFSSFQ